MAILDPLRRAQAEAKRAHERFLRQMARERRLNPDDVGLPYEAFSLEADDGQELAAWFVPGAPGATLGAFVHHHYGGQKATVLPWLELFHEAGVPALAIDGRGHAASAELIDDDEARAFSARQRDVEAACEELRRRGLERLLVVGQSQAAAPVIVVAGRRDDVVAVVADSGPSPSIEVATWGLAGEIVGSRRQPLMQALVCLEIWRGGRVRGYTRALWQGLRQLRQRPLMWIHSVEDKVIPRPLAETWFRLHRPPGDGWTALTLNSGGHVQPPSPGTPLSRALRAFIDRAL